MLLQSLTKKLASRKNRGLIRTIDAVVDRSGIIDFASNDYLGLSSSSDFGDKVLQRYKANIELSKQFKAPFLGSSGSRLLSGTSDHFTRVESVISESHGSSSSLIFNSGYVANLGIFGSVCGEESDTIVLDESVHSSVWEGCKLGRQGRIMTFRHNDVDDFRSVLKKIREEEMPSSSSSSLLSSSSSSRGKIMVGIEGVYSMDGTKSPVHTLAEIAAEFDAMVVVDEAHSTGVVGEVGICGSGDDNLYQHPGILCSVHTYGKAWGGAGASVCCGEVLREWLVNYARGQVFSTSLPLFTLSQIEEGYALMKSSEGHSRRESLNSAIAHWNSAVESNSIVKNRVIAGGSWIQGVLIPGNEAVVDVCRQMNEKGFGVYPIRSPTVEKGGERIRIVLHAFNKKSEIDELVEALGECIG